MRTWGGKDGNNDHPQHFPFMNPCKTDAPFRPPLSTLPHVA